jgi:hypothetical protein
VARHRAPLTPPTEPAHESAREGSRDNHYRPGSKARASRGGWRPNSGADETMNRDRPGRPGPGVLTPSRGTVGGHHLRSGAWSGDVSAHRRSRVTYLHGGFVDLADLVGPAEIVTLDRVINVYPGWERLTGLAAGRANGCSASSYPRATRVVRLIIVAMNLVLRLQTRPVRAFFCSGDPIERIAAANGLTLTSRMTSTPRGRSRSFAENEPSARSEEAAALFRSKASSRDDDQD